MRLFCTTDATKSTPSGSDGTVHIFTPWDRHGSQFASSGSVMLPALRKFGLALDETAVDLLRVILSVVAADQSIKRTTSADGWTRSIDLTIGVHDPDRWSDIAGDLVSSLQFLTTDVWTLAFVSEGYALEGLLAKKTFDKSGVTLLSGGLDSLVGAYEHPDRIVVSQVAGPDTMVQTHFAKAMSIQHHLQTNHGTRKRRTEDTQRSRSLLFLTLAVIVATHMRSHRDGGDVEVMIPENGFIALNPPLTELRIGALSTRTAHPHYLSIVECFFRALGMKVRIVNPYRYHTKGEMLLPHVGDQKFLELASMSTSCSGFVRHKRQHCGRCVPCQIRRAAFLRASIRDRTKERGPTNHQSGYQTPNIADFQDPNALHDDVRAVREALQGRSDDAYKRLHRSILAYPSVRERDRLAGVIERGFNELQLLHENDAEKAKSSIAI